jgi:hypothetical protein
LPASENPSTLVGPCALGAEAITTTITAAADIFISLIAARVYTKGAHERGES